MARGDFDDDDGDFLELCPDTSEFADDESLVQEITAGKIAESQTASANTNVVPRTSVNATSAAVVNSSDTSEEEDDDSDSRPGRRRRHDRYQRRHREETPQEAESTPSEAAESAANGTSAVPPAPPSGSGSLSGSGSVSHKKSSFKKNKSGERSNQPPAIHINKNFTGTVQAAPGTCLAWDSGILGHRQPTSYRGNMGPFSVRPPQFRSHFPGVASGGLLGSAIRTGAPFYGGPPPFRPMPQMPRQGAMWQERMFNGPSFGGGGARPQFPSAMRRNHLRNRPYFNEKPKQFRPPHS